MRILGRRTQDGRNSVRPGASTGVAEGTERARWTNLKQAQESADESCQAVLSVNEGTHTENSRCDPYSEALLK